MSHRKTKAFLDGFLSVYGLEARGYRSARACGLGFARDAARIRGYWALAVDSADESANSHPAETDEGRGSDVETA